MNPAGRVFSSKQLRDFVLNVFADVPGKRIAVGRFLGKEAALSLIAAWRRRRQYIAHPRRSALISAVRGPFPPFRPSHLT
jgi:hypothetical protein